jgi:hypothetical protein
MLKVSKKLASGLILVTYCVFLAWMSTCVFGSETPSHHHHHGPLHHQHNPLTCGWAHSVGDGAFLAFEFATFVLFLLGRLLDDKKNDLNRIFNFSYSGRAPPLCPL